MNSVTAASCCLALLSLSACVHHAVAYPSPGGYNNNQWSNPGMGMQHGYNNGGGQQRGFGNGFGQRGGYTQNGGGYQSGYNGERAEAYRTNVFNEPDRYGYDYTMPGANVHFLMYKKQGNRRPESNYGVDPSGWNRNNY